MGYDPPSARTVHRILVRNGLVSSPPQEQSVREIIDHHYPAFQITAPGMLHQPDLVGPRSLKGSGQTYYVYNLRDVCSRRIAIEIGTNRKSRSVADAFITSWQRMGIPTILPHDNA